MKKPLTKVQFDTIHLQLRDLALLRGLFESRVMTAAHIATLYFNGSKEAAKKRLQKIKSAGFIGERRRRSYEPAVLHLTRKGLTVLHQHGILAEYPAINLPSLDRRANVSELTLRHELQIMDVKAAVHSAIKGTDTFTIAEFSTWPLLYQFETPRNGYGADILVKPDGFIRIHEKESDDGLSEHTFFLEVDLSTEVQDTLIERAGCYLDYYKSGGFAVKNGAPRSEFKDFPFRVLMVFKSAERRNNTAARLLQNTPPILTQVCLATFDEFVTDPLGTIWIQPKDYRDMTKGTPFDTARKIPTFGYKSQPEREAFIEAKIRKFRLLDN